MVHSKRIMIEELPNDIFNIIINILFNFSTKDILAVRLVSKMFYKELPKFTINKIKMEKIMTDINCIKGMDAPRLGVLTYCINCAPHRGWRLGDRPASILGIVYLYYINKDVDSNSDSDELECKHKQQLPYWSRFGSEAEFRHFKKSTSIKCIQRNFPYCKDCIKDYNLIGITSPKLIYSIRDAHYIDI